MKNMVDTENLLFKRIIINLGIISGSFLCSLVLELILAFFAANWGYDLQIIVTPENNGIFYSLGKQFQFFAVVISCVLLALILLAFFKRRSQDPLDFLRLASVWFFVVSGLLLGFGFFFPEGMGLSHSREFYWRAALPFTIIGLGFTIRITSEVLEDQQKGKVLGGWLGLVSLLALGIFIILHQDANHPWMLSLTLGLHYLISFWILGVTVLMIGRKVFGYASWRDVVAIIACGSLIILFIVAFPPLIPRNTTYLELYHYFAVFLVLGAFALLLWAFNEVCYSPFGGAES
ncbi:MAG: hypothetical protein ACFFBD_04490 [Candidatus Hodarchaeota archaeon]